MVEQGQFRADLYYRLNVFPIVIPPLRERREDIPILVRYFVEKYAKAMNRKIERIPQSVMDAITRYGWPGNIRELQNFMERAVILSEGPALRPPLGELRESKAKASSASTLKEVEQRHILQVLRDCDWVLGGPQGAAARLGIPRTTLIYRMRRLGIQEAAGLTGSFVAVGWCRTSRHPQARHHCFFPKTSCFLSPSSIIKCPCCRQAKAAGSRVA